MDEKVIELLEQILDRLDEIDEAIQNLSKPGSDYSFGRFDDAE